MWAASVPGCSQLRNQLIQRLGMLTTKLRPHCECAGAAVPLTHSVRWWDRNSLIASTIITYSADTSSASTVTKACRWCLQAWHITVRQTPGSETESAARGRSDDSPKADAMRRSDSELNSATCMCRTEGLAGPKLCVMEAARDALDAAHPRNVLTCWSDINVLRSVPRLGTDAVSKAVCGSMCSDLRQVHPRSAFMSTSDQRRQLPGCRYQWL